MVKCLSTALPDRMGSVAAFFGNKTTPSLGLTNVTGIITFAAPMKLATTDNKQIKNIDKKCLP